MQTVISSKLKKFVNEPFSNVGIVEMFNRINESEGIVFTKTRSKGTCFEFWYLDVIALFIVVTVYIFSL